MPILLSSEPPPQIKNMRKIGFVYGAMGLSAGFLALISGHDITAILLLTVGFSNSLRWIRMPKTYVEESQDSERAEWHAIARGPVSTCPGCGWNSYNGNVTRCAECGAPLKKAPARGLS